MDKPAAALAIPLRRLPHGSGLPLPAYATAGSVGLDLAAAIDSPVELAPGARALIPTGFALALPTGYEAQVRPRSGLALKNGITVLNAPGTVDSDYRGEVGVVLINLGEHRFTVTRGMRIAQLVVAPVTHAEPHEVGVLPPTGRASGGFGSTEDAGAEKSAAPSRRFAKTIEGS
jgi:dUTP diphosphatase